MLGRFPTSPFKLVAAVHCLGTQRLPGAPGTLLLLSQLKENLLHCIAIFRGRPTAVHTLRIYTWRLQTPRFYIWNINSSVAIGFIFYSCFKTHPSPTFEVQRALLVTSHSGWQNVNQENLFSVLTNVFLRDFFFKKKKHFRQNFLKKGINQVRWRRNFPREQCLHLKDALGFWDAPRGYSFHRQERWPLRHGVKESFPLRGFITLIKRGQQ